MPLTTRRSPTRPRPAPRRRTRPAAESTPRAEWERHRPASARVFLALLGAAVCALLTVLATAGPASAHAVQTDSSPGEGRVVSGPPEEVTVTFSEGVSMPDGSIRVLGPDGKRLDTSEVRKVSGKPNTRAVGLKPDGPKGTYTVAWKAVSDDSHPVSGAFTFSVGHPSQTSANVAEESQEPGGGPVGATYHTARYAAYAGFVLLVGGGAFVVLCEPRNGAVRRVQRLVVTGWLTLTAATLLMLLLRNAYTGTGQLTEVFDLGGLRRALGSKPGAALAARLLLLGTAAVIVSVLFGAYGEDRKGRDEPEARGGESGDGDDADAQGDVPVAHQDGGRHEQDAGDRSGGGEESGRPGGRDVPLGPVLGGGVVAVALAVTWVVAEHASTGLQTEVAMPVHVVHLLAVAAWLGGLASLLTVLHRGPSPGRALVQRFSRVAFGSVLVLAVTGLYQSWRQLGSFTALTGTAYGRLLLAKLALVAVLLLAAGASRRWTARLRDMNEETQPAGRARAAAPAGVGAAASGAPDALASGEAGGAGAHEDSAEAGEAGGTEDDAGRTARDTARTGDAGRDAELARQRAAVDRERRRKERAADPDRAGLRRSVLAEASIAAVLLVVTTALTSTEPGRTEELSAAAKKPGAATGQKRVGTSIQQKIPFDTGGKNGKGTAVLLITPGQAGGNSLRLLTEDPQGKQLATEEVKASLTLPEQDLGPFSVEFERINDAKGRWRSELVQLPMPGRWKASVTIRTSDIDQVTESKTVELE